MLNKIPRLPPQIFGMRFNNITGVWFLSAEKWVRGRAIDRGEVDIGTQQSQAIPPGLFWRFHMTVHHPTYIKFNLSLSHNALLGVYGRRNIPPTHTQVREASVETCCLRRWGF